MSINIKYVEDKPWRVEPNKPLGENVGQLIGLALLVKTVNAVEQAARFIHEEAEFKAARS